MKKLILGIALIAVISLGGFMPFDGTDVAKLHPIEVLAVSSVNNLTVVRTDTGLIGIGGDVKEAIGDMKASSPGVIFMETANYLLFERECEYMLTEVFEFIRPACQIYIYEVDGEMEDIAKYLENHPSGVTALRYKQGNSNVPEIMSKDGVYKIVKP